LVTSTREEWSVLHEVQLQKHYIESFVQQGLSTRDYIGVLIQTLLVRGSIQYPRIFIMEKGKRNDSVMLNMGARLNTYKLWPFNEDCMCTSEKMAAAGFYYCGNEDEPDLVRCYFCRKELDGWEPDDDPWKEHVSHAKGNCAYVNLGKKPSELTVSDVLGLLEARKSEMILTKGATACEEEFSVVKEETYKDIDNLAPKSC